MSFLSGVKVLNRAGESLDAAKATKDKIVALYFSAGWCPSCRQLTPKIKRFYEDVKAAGKPFEIILVSRDREAEDLVEYFEEKNGDWLYLEFGDPHIQEYLKYFEVPTIPAVRIIRPDGSVALGQEARIAIQERGSEEPLVVFSEFEKAVAATA